MKSEGFPSRIESMTLEQVLFIVKEWWNVRGMTNPKLVAELKKHNRIIRGDKTTMLNRLKDAYIEIAVKQVCHLLL
jgi:hypothetical protein